MLPTVVAAALAAAAAGCADNSSSSSDAGGTSYPERAVSLVVPFAAGGGTDTNIRPLAPKLEEALGQSVVVVNKPGGGGVVGTTEVASAEPDGYTVGTPEGTVLTLQPIVNKSLGYSVDSFDAIKLAEAPYLVVTRSAAPWGGLQDFLDAAKTQPGTLGYGVPGLGSANDLNARALQLAADVELRPVPFAGGGADVLAALLRGDVDVAVVIFSTVKGLVESGELKALAVLQPERLPVLPDVPGLEDLQLESPFFFGGSGYLTVPAATSDDVVEVLASAAQEALADTVLQKLYVDQGSAADYLGPQDAKAELTQRQQKLTELLDQFPDLQPAK